MKNAPKKDKTKRRDGTLFRIEPERGRRSPFAKVIGLRTRITTREMLEIIREGREPRRP